MWTLWMFFYEVRLVVSIGILFYQWYHMDLLNIYLQQMTQRVMRKLAKVPVTVDRVAYYFPNTVHVYNFRIKPPPPEVDNRWEWEDIITIDLVDVKFNLIIAAVFYFVSFDELYVLESISVHGLRFFVEGHKGLNDEQTIFNMNLLGGGPRPKPLVSNESTKEEAKAVVYGKIDYDDSYFSTRSDSSESDVGDVRVATSSSSSSSHQAQIQSQTHGATSNGKANLSTYFKSTMSNFWSITDKVKTEARSFHESVQETGFYNTTKKKLNSLIDKTKQSIDYGIRERLKNLHAKISGPEPSPAEGDVRFIVDLLVFDLIEVHLLRALPPQLRHLEARPLVILELQFDHVGYEGLRLLDASGGDRATRRHSHGSHVQVSYGAIGEGKVQVPPKSRKQKGDHRDAEASTALPPLRHPSPSSTPHTMPDSPSALSTPDATHSTRHPTPAHAPYELPASAPSTPSQTHVSSDAPAAANNSSAPPAALRSKLMLDLSSIDVYSSGLDVRVLRYRFEQQMMLALYQGNLGRLVSEIFSFKREKGVSVGVAGSERLTGTGVAGSSGRVSFAEAKVQQAQQTANVIYPTAAPPPTAQPASHSHQASQLDRSMFMQDEFLYSDPIFFDK